MVSVIQIDRQLIEGREDVIEVLSISQNTEAIPPVDAYQVDRVNGVSKIEGTRELVRAILAHSLKPIFALIKHHSIRS